MRWTKKKRQNRLLKFWRYIYDPKLIEEEKRLEAALSQMNRPSKNASIQA